MHKKAKVYGIIVLSVVAVVAVLGLVLYFSGGITGTYLWSYQSNRLWSQSSCTDPYEPNPYIKDYVESYGMKYYDQCQDANTLQEAICIRSGRRYWPIDCGSRGYTCQEGACVRKTLINSS